MFYSDPKQCVSCGPLRPRMQKQRACDSSRQPGTPGPAHFLTVAALTFTVTCKQGPHAGRIPRATLGPPGWPLGPLLGQVASQLVSMECVQGIIPGSVLLKAVCTLLETSACKSVRASMGLRHGYFWPPAISFTRYLYLTNGSHLCTDIRLLPA